MAAAGVRSAVGLDPVAVFEEQFNFLSSLALVPNTTFERAGYEALRLRPKAYDVIFCLGILYHHPEPIAILRLAREALKPGGMLVIETMAVPERFVGPHSQCLILGSRYLGTKGVWFVPNRPGLANWIRRSGFGDFAISDEYVGFGDQHKTEFAPLPEPGDFLDPAQPNLTVEGLPAPVRLHAWARR